MKVIFVILIALISGCSVHYGPRVPGFVPGYVDKQIGESTYQVRIGEAWPKDWHDLDKFAMYRAAEITKQRGLRYFQVLKASTAVNSYVLTSPSTTTTSGTITGYGNTALYRGTSTTYGGGSSTISGGWYTLDFKVRKSEEVEAAKNVVDSESIFSDLKFFIESGR